ncbi:MAG: deoxyguanosinetriphosphate triphosphohydrolase [Moraxella sp.]|nr:deoxyguanosinetriphosphate triphosphohydrolase [Moraxella sp.]
MTHTQKWQSLLCADRLWIENGEIREMRGEHSPIRSQFHTDYDRVVFSSSFRKLGRKTQVHPLAKSDHTHNRLTHSVEVASVGRSLGNSVGVSLADRQLLPDNISPQDIGTLVQVACLAHDLGNPPFGHTGEDALREWFCKNSFYLQWLSDKEKADLTTYEGNAHSLRIVANLEMYQDAGGMRLTCASLGTLLKYPWGSFDNDKPQVKFNIYQSEMPLIRAVAKALDLKQLGDDKWARHPLSYLMEAADDICYAILDLEDAVELELIDVDKFAEILSILLQDDFAKYQKIPILAQRIGAMRGKAIGLAIDEVKERFLAHHDELLAGEFAHKDLLSVCDNRVKDCLQNAKELARQKIYKHPSKLSIEVASFGCLGAILELIVPAIHARLTGQELGVKHTLILELLGNDYHINTNQSLYQGYLTALDFVGGLTDNSAGRLARELSGVGIG